MTDIQQQTLWREAFMAQDGDMLAEQRERLRTALERMRRNVTELVATIPADCRDLTVHDVTHLDALWEMGSLIAGPHYDLNPAEAFVFGAAVLLHDAGMSVAAFPQGLDQIKRTVDWQDLAAAVLRQHGQEPSPALIASPPAELMPIIKFLVLRALHAAQAGRMACVAWELPGGKGTLHLIDDQELRQAFGETIGRVAHSHHWPIEKVADTLVDNVGAGTVLPAEWKVSERKVACLLRCADAAHMDRRRAPTFTYAATRPQGLSGTHWAAQNKINKPAVDGGTLIISAGEAFPSSEADAWWLVYDLCRVLDGEIRSSNALLEEMRFQPFSIRRVLGAESPRALSKYIRPDGWKPIDAEVRVSDPLHLARTLGGRHLYGLDPMAPVRELLQNSVDAVRARRELEERDKAWGSIRLIIEPVAEEPEACWLHVDDNGIGMTERVMAGPLIDFGKSLWSSPLLREEFPGLQSKNIHPIGRFGIGFFSVFELGDNVRVVSKRYDAGAADAKTLEFRSLSTRPLIRPATAGEFPRDYSTRVSVKIERSGRLLRPRLDGSMYSPRQQAPATFENALLQLIVLADVKVEYINRLDGAGFVHDADAYGSPASHFLEELLGTTNTEMMQKVKSAHVDLLRELEDDEGQRYGRAALYMFGRNPLDSSYRSFGVVTVGSFSYVSGRGLPVPYVGAVVGNTEDVARRSASSGVPEPVLAKWATGQAAAIDPARFSTTQLLRAALTVLRAGGNSGSLPYAYYQKGFVTFDVAKERIRSLSTVIVPITIEYSSAAKLLGHGSMGATYFEHQMVPELFVIGDHDERLFEDELTRAIVKGGGREVMPSEIKTDGGDSTLAHFLRTVEECWESTPEMSVDSAQLFQTGLYFPPGPAWVLKCKRRQ